MAMAPATRAPGGAGVTRLVSKSGFSVASPIRLPRRAGGSRAGVLGVAARSGRRDGWPGADSNSSSSSSGGGGRLVDADMATLRRRIREARAESAEEDGIDTDGDEAGGGLAPLPAEWTELERRHHGSYVAGVRGAVGLLEALLVSARPGLGAGLLGMLLLGVPASMFLVCAHLVQALDSVSSGLLTGR
ncbi:unnamed protein product [Urochloa humidicola]